MLGRFHHAKVVLGSATPSVESYYQATTGKWGFIKLDKRFGDAQLPEIILVDTLREKKFKTMRNDFSSALLENGASAPDERWEGSHPTQQCQSPCHRSPSSMFFDHSTPYRAYKTSSRKSCIEETICLAEY